MARYHALCVFLCSSFNYKQMLKGKEKQQHLCGGLPWSFSGEESTLRCKRHEFNPWSGKWYPTSRGTMKPARHNCWALALEPSCCNCCTPQLESVYHNKEPACYSLDLTRQKKKRDLCGQTSPTKVDFLGRDWQLCLLKCYLSPLFLVASGPWRPSSSILHTHEDKNCS